MADNFLENKFDEYRQKKCAPTTKSGHSLDSLLKKNRSYRGYDHAWKVPTTVLEKMIEVTQWVPTGKNQQAFRFNRPMRADGLAVNDSTPQSKSQQGPAFSFPLRSK